MTNWAYNRTVHLVLLLLLLVLFVITWQLILGFSNWISYSGLYWPFLAILFVLLLYLRGLGSLRSYFPWFHYGTLIGELVVHLVTVVVWTINLAIAIHRGFVFGSTPADLVIGLFRLLLHAVYVVLLIACVLHFYKSKNVKML